MDARFGAQYDGLIGMGDRANGTLSLPVNDNDKWYCDDEIPRTFNPNIRIHPSVTPPSEVNEQDVII